MLEMVVRVMENLVERTEGPMNLRFLLQPAMAIFLAVRAGLRDVKNETIPYLWRFATSQGNRKMIAKEGWKDFGKVFIIATALDVVYQFLVIFGMKTERGFYPLESIIVAFLLSLIPYIFFRGPVSRVVRWLRTRKHSRRE